MGDKQARELKARVAASPLRQFEIAKHLGIDESQFSRLLNGIAPLPEGFENALTAAMRAAAEERAKRLLESVGGEVAAV